MPWDRGSLEDVKAAYATATPRDYIAVISLFRPGPRSGVGCPALHRARPGAAPTPPHPDLEPVLCDTYGVTIWPE